MFRISSLTEKTALIAISRIFAKFTTIIISIILVRLITQEEYGLYRQVFFVLAFLEQILQLGLPKSFYYFIPGLDAQKRSTFVTQTLLFLFLLGLIGSGILFIFSDILAELFNDPMLAVLFKIGSLYVIFGMVSYGFLRILLISSNLHKKAAFNSFWFPVSFSLFLIIPVLLGFSVMEMIISIILIRIIQTSYTIIVTKNVIKKFQFGFYKLKEQLNYAFPIGFSEATGLFATQMDKLLIAYFYPATMFAIYTIGATQIPLITIITTSISATLIPALRDYNVKENNKGIVKLCNEATRKLSVILFPFFTWMLFFSKPFILLLYTDQYSLSVNIFRIFLFNMPLKIFIFHVVLLALGHSKIIWFRSIILMILSICLSFIGIRLFGYIGPPIGLILAEIIGYVYLGYKTTRLTPYKIRDLISPTVVHIIFISMLSGFIVLPLNFSTLNNALILIFSAVLFSITYLFLSIRLKIITRNDIDLVKKWILFKKKQTKSNEITS